MSTTLGRDARADCASTTLADKQPTTADAISNRRMSSPPEQVPNRNADADQM
jgi:hypothetical protein